MAGRCDQNDSRSWSCRQPMDCWVVVHQVKINFQKSCSYRNRMDRGFGKLIKKNIMYCILRLDSEV